MIASRDKGCHQELPTPRSMRFLNSIKPCFPLGSFQILDTGERHEQAAGKRNAHWTT